jgi:C_GCAxxG_C_C family probable redox protein
MERKELDKTTGLIKRCGKEFNCCQSTLLHIHRKHPLLGFESNIMRAASPFGGGVGSWGSACGAATGIVMALGLVYGPDGEESLEEFQEKKGKVNAMSKSIMKEFEEVFGSVNCNDLLGMDRRTNEFRALYTEMKQAQNRTSGLDICDEYIEWAAKKVLETLGEG